MTNTDRVSIEKDWGLVYGDLLLLKAETEGELRNKMARTRVPDGAEVVALPKPHGGIFL